MSVRDKNIMIGRDLYPAIEQWSMYIGDTIQTGLTGTSAVIKDVVAVGRDITIGRILGTPSNQPVKSCSVFGQGIELLSDFLLKLP